MACGEFGMGRMAEPETIAAAIGAALAGPVASRRALTGRRVLVTAGPTIEPIDPVRFLSNRSSGKQGFAIAAALAALGARVELVSGPVALPAPKGVHIRRVETAREMLAACTDALPADAAICVAAVADWRPQTPAGAKLKKDRSGAPPAVHLVENPDILAALSAPSPGRPRLVIGFAAETNDIEAHARAKIDRKGCDWILANDVSGDVMGGDLNEVILIRKDGTERWPRMGKDAVGARLAAAVADALSSPAVAP
jgi:phosphopantothenoylcysteine decarboxylase/phosphopantothenate--cysteine ligase